MTTIKTELSEMVLDVLRAAVINGDGSDVNITLGASNKIVDEYSERIVKVLTDAIHTVADGFVKQPTEGAKT